MAASTYIWRNGMFVDKKTGEPMLKRGHNGGPPINERICAPMVMRDIPEHIGPSGRHITSRSAYRDELKRTGSVPPDKGLKGGSYGYLDPAVAKRNGARFDPDNVERFKADRKAAFKAAGL